MKTLLVLCLLFLSVCALAAGQGSAMRPVQFSRKGQ